MNQNCWSTRDLWSTLQTEKLQLSLNSDLPCINGSIQKKRTYPSWEPPWPTTTHICVKGSGSAEQDTSKSDPLGKVLLLKQQIGVKIPFSNNVLIALLRHVALFSKLSWWAAENPTVFLLAFNCCWHWSAVLPRKPLGNSREYGVDQNVTGPLAFRRVEVYF